MLWLWSWNNLKDSTNKTTEVNNVQLTRRRRWWCTHRNWGWFTELNWSGNKKLQTGNNKHLRDCYREIKKDRKRHCGTSWPRSEDFLPAGENIRTFTGWIEGVNTRRGSASISISPPGDNLGLGTWPSGCFTRTTCWSVAPRRGLGARALEGTAPRWTRVWRRCSGVWTWVWTIPRKRPRQQRRGVNSRRCPCSARLPWPPCTTWQKWKSRLHPRPYWLRIRKAVRVSSKGPSPHPRPRRTLSRTFCLARPARKPSTAGWRRCSPGSTPPPPDSISTRPRPPPAASLNPSPTCRAGPPSTGRGCYRGPRRGDIPVSTDKHEQKT